MTSGESDIIDLKVQILHERDKAILVDDGDRKVWLPKSMIEFEPDAGTLSIVSLPEWLARDKELI